MIPIADLLREALLWLGWQSLAATAVFAVVVVLARLLGRARPAVLAALWGLVLARLVLPVDLASPVSLRALVDRLVAPPPVHAAATAGEVPEIRVPASARGEAASIRPTLDPVVPLGCVWLAGCAVAGVRWLGARRRFRRVAVAARTIDAGVLRSLVDDARRRLGVRRSVRLRVTDVAVAPFTVGVFRPEVVLPTAVAVRPELAATVIAHELAHVRRLDVAWMAVERMLAVVYWFHPVVWLTVGRRHEARERACDTLVVERASVPARRYAHDLLAVVRLGLEPVAAPAASLPMRRLDMRIRSILDADVARHRSPIATAAVVLTAALLLPLASPAEPPPVAVDAPGAEVRAASGPAMRHPLPDGRLTWGWGPGRDPFTGDEAHHRGVDLAAPTGTPVQAVAAGTVVEATDHWTVSPSSGTVVVLDHGDRWSTLYTHLDAFEVQPGENVESGQVIGRVGSSGRSTGPHLHFEVRRDGQPVDPATVVEGLRR
jgi:murein DD-endopeptidase MepM/ murein hydrolase activator NlpD